MSLMEVKRKVGELKLDLQTMLDQRFTDESDELAIAGLIDRSLKCMDDLILETDLLDERMNLLEAEVRAANMKPKAKKKAKRKPAKKKAGKKSRKAKPKKKAGKATKKKAKRKTKRKKKR